MIKSMMMGVATVLLFSTAFADSSCPGIAGTWSGTYTMSANTQFGYYTCTYPDTLTVKSAGSLVLMSAAISNGRSTNPRVICEGGQSITFEGQCNDESLNVVLVGVNANLEGGVIGNQMVLSGQGGPANADYALNETQQSSEGSASAKAK